MKYTLLYLTIGFVYIGCGSSSNEALKNPSFAGVAIQATPQTQAPCGPYDCADGIIGDAQGDFECVVDQKLGEVSCRIGSEAYQKVSGVSDVAELPFGSELGFCVSTKENQMYCFDHTLKAVLQ